MSIPTPGRGPAVIRVTIEQVHPLTGSATSESGSGEERRFDGWLGLLGVLSQLVGAAEHTGKLDANTVGDDFAGDSQR